ncbi:MAG TPA: hypothetical protein VGC64_06695, partial [Pyrinomonadaceae bacterium]
KNKVFKPLDRSGPRRAQELVKEGEKLFRRENSKPASKAGKRKSARPKKQSVGRGRKASGSDKA